ncbi:MAG: hypothetical protein HC921_04835 [Synechococcaceae cyanobacterium SM2_3_1]|nr:hypothetical protein [Synechococcaceae cyanobacterium SM2_3_1]
MQRFFPLFLPLLVSGGPLLLSGFPAFAQDPPAETFQPGPWQPQARVNPEMPIQVRLVNFTGLAMEYGLTSMVEPSQQLAADGVALFNVVNLPDFLTINTLERAALRYELQPQEDRNLLEVNIRRIDDVMGDRTIQFDDTGAIYVY